MRLLFTITSIIFGILFLLLSILKLEGSFRQNDLNNIYALFEDGSSPALLIIVDAQSFEVVNIQRVGADWMSVRINDSGILTITFVYLGRDSFQYEELFYRRMTRSSGGYATGKILSISLDTDLDCLFVNDYSMSGDTLLHKIEKQEIDSQDDCISYY